MKSTKIIAVFGVVAFFASSVAISYAAPVYMITSNTEHVETMTIVNPPTDVRAWIQKGKNNKTYGVVAWRDNSNNEPGFRIQRGKLVNGEYRWTTVADLGPNTTYWRDYGLRTTKDVLYRVRAYNKHSDEPYVYSVSNLIYE